VGGRVLLLVGDQDALHIEKHAGSKKQSQKDSNRARLQSVLTIVGQYNKGLCGRNLGYRFPTF
jgi:hypothetical protein